MGLYDKVESYFTKDILGNDDDVDTSTGKLVLTRTLYIIPAKYVPLDITENHWFPLTLNSNNTAT